MKEGRVLLPAEIVAIFKRFPEGNPYYIPLFLAYAYGMDKDEAFAITVNDVRDASYIITTRKVKYNRSNNQHYISKARDCYGHYIASDREVENVIRRAVINHFHKNHRVINRVCYDKKINTKTGMPIFFLNTREDGSFISPQGINHVARVIHGKKGKFEYVDPEWKFEDMITSGYYYRHKIFA